MPNVGSPPFLLLVEGQDDRHFVKQVWDKHHNGSSKLLFFNGAEPPFGISDKGNFNELCKDIPTQITTPGREVLGILVDANGDLMKQWHEISSELKKTCKLTGASKHLQLNPSVIPDAPDPTGTIIDSKPRIGIWLMPDNQSPGELEDFAAEMIPEHDPVWPLSKEYIQNIPKQHRKFDCNKTQKAELFAWLATRKEPGRMGAAIGADDLTLDNKPSETFLKWLSDLFK